MDNRDNEIEEDRDENKKDDLDDQIEDPQKPETHNEDNKEEEKKEEEPQIIPASKELSSNSICSFNWLAHYYFVRNEFVECIGVFSKYCKTQNDFECYYSLFIKGLIKRAGGEINESLVLFKNSFSLNNTSQYILRETGKNFYLLGKYKMAIEIYDSLIDKNEEDWDSIYHKGLCLMNMKNYDEANELFEKAYEINPTPIILKTQGKLLLLQSRIEDALEKYEEAKSLSVDDSELLAKIATLQLRLENSSDALANFEKAIKINPDYSSGFLGLSSIYQYQGDYDKAFDLYKLSQNTNPNSASVWNNIGLCYLGIGKYVYATSCLTKAFYLEPFTWGIAFNLGLALMNMGLYASAFTYMNTAASLKKDDYKIYMFLGVILGELNDPNNAIAYYNKALSFGDNYLILFNYTVTLVKHNMISNARNIFARFKSNFSGGEEDSCVDDINQAIPVLERALG